MECGEARKGRRNVLGRGTVQVEAPERQKDDIRRATAGRRQVRGAGAEREAGAWG